jgi:hypothetical protein
MPPKAELCLVITRLAGQSETILQVVWWTGLTTVVLALLIVVQIIALRWMLLIRQKREQQFLSFWQPLLMESLEETPTRVPPVHKKNHLSFLTLWTYMHESLRDEARENLSRVACLAGMDAVARKWIDQGNTRERLIAIQVAGQLRDASSWDALLNAAENSANTDSLIAARSLMRIDAVRGVEVLMPLIARRRDWPQAVVAEILREAGPEIISAPLSSAIHCATAENLPRLIRLLEVALVTVTAPAIREVLRRNTEQEIITSCLKMLNSPEDRSVIQTFLTDERWQVRVQAVSALGRIGSDEDVPLLVKALNDGQWWVRYRAAQSLANLVSPEQLEKISEEQSGFERDILNQVQAERKW